MKPCKVPSIGELPDDVEEALAAITENWLAYDLATKEQLHALRRAIWRMVKDARLVSREARRHIKDCRAFINGDTDVSPGNARLLCALKRAEP